MDEFEELPARLAGIAEVLARERWQLSHRELVAAHHDVRVVVRSLQALASQLLGVIDAEGLAELAGARTTAHWLSSREVVDMATAKREVAAARTIASGRAPRSAAAWAGGGVDAARVQIVTETVGTLVDGDVDPGQVAEAEVLLAEQAALLRPRELSGAAKRIRLHLLPERTDRADDPATRSMTLAQTTDGVGVFSGELDAEGYEVVTTALATFTVPNAEGDCLTAAQQRGQAFVQLCRAALTGAGAPTTNGAATTVVVTVPLSALSSGEGAAEVPWGQPLDAGAARRLACDAKLVPVVLGGPSEPLDVGRSSYRVPSGLRRALVVRDGGCVHPGCDRPPAHTEAHHLVHWVEGGETKLSNLVLLCSHHHHVTHDTGWSITLDERGIPYSTAPQWADPDQRRRYHARHLVQQLGDIS